MSTIAAISTAPGNAGIGIIRLSGEKCFEILDKIFVPKHKGEIKGYTMKYGHIISASSKEIIDEVLVSYFVAPNSYTRENMCEINSHGGMVVENKILEECLKNGAMLAEPGEFTKRAFLNGRIDLSQAEAIIDIINSKTEKEMQVAQRQLKGRLSNKIEDIRKDILNIMADIEASIDYPEYDIEETTNEIIENETQETEGNIEQENTTPEVENPEPVIVEEPVKPLEFVYPVEGEILKSFAMENLVFSETLQEWVVHKGIDIKAPRTTIVKAAEEGTVKSIKNDPRYGLTVIIEHREGYKTIYSNLLTTEFVTEGETVTKGQSIGTVGNSAAFEIADEPHLHFEMLKDDVTVDPTLYLK